MVFAGQLQYFADFYRFQGCHPRYEEVARPELGRAGVLESGELNVINR